MSIFQPVEFLANFIVFNIFNIEEGTVLFGALTFFIYDSIKILILLIIVTHLMSLMRYYLPIKKFRNFLIKRKLYGLDYLFASVFGVITPFCSCSSIPLFIGFLQAGIPAGVAFSFLITSPLVNEIAISVFIGLFGWKIASLYAFAGIIIGIIGGLILNKLKVEKYIINFKKEEGKCCCQNNKLTKKQVFLRVSKDAFSIVRNITPYLLVGVAIGAIIHGYVPTGFFENYLQKENFLTVPIAVILAVPLYSNAAGVIPIVQALISKGVPLGTALAFMMATVGLSLPEALILKKVLRIPLLIMFFTVVALGIVCMGYTFNFIL